MATKGLLGTLVLARNPQEHSLLFFHPNSIFIQFLN